MKLTKKEEAWLARFEKCMAAAPKSLGKKVSSYTVGDPFITIFDKDLVWDYEATLSNDSRKDMCQIVDEIEGEILTVYFPFNIESTAG